MSSKASVLWGYVVSESYKPEPYVVSPYSSAIKSEDFSFWHMRNKPCHVFVHKFFRSPPESALDLSAASEVNILPMAQKGTQLACVRHSQKLLDCCVKHENIEYFCADLTKIASYGENISLVLAIDILSLIPPSKLQSTMKKIHSCLCEDGTLVGTIQTSTYSPAAQKMMRPIGCVFYQGGERFVRDLIAVSGFQVEKLEEDSGTFSFQAKKNSNGFV